MSSRLLILGASVRAAAFSALRAGMVPHCTDLFADVDLRRCADARTVDSYPEGLLAAARESRAESWMYTGGLENYPHLIDQIAAECPLAGNRGDVLRAVRNPHRLGRALRARGLAVPPTSPTSEGIPGDGSWLEKPLRGSGGAGISLWHGPGRRTTAPPPAGRYYQQRVAGVSCSAVYIAARREAVLLGASRQLVGTKWAAARQFHYAGSIGPLALRPRLREQFEAIGRVLAREFGLVGLFGVDTVINGSKVYTIEVNPRYPASVEVLERAGAFSAVELHLAACLGNDLPAAESPGELRHGHIRWGKCILFARRDLTVNEAFAQLAADAMREGVNADLADIPPLGAAISAGRPITTVLAEAEDQASVLNALRQRVARIEQTMAAL